MTSVKIKFHECAEVQEFVNAAERCSYDVDISRDRIIIDAKSLLGVMSMDLRKPLTVRYCAEDTALLQPILSRLSVG